jgi:hypothetical protein
MTAPARSWRRKAAGVRRWNKPVTRARIAKVALVLATVTAAPIGTYLVWTGSASGTALERTLWDIGFYPIRPPSTLVAPGSIYHVSADGRFYTIICKADEEETRRLMERSSSEETVARELQNGAYKLDLASAGAINARLKGDVVESVTYSLRDVSVLEIPLEKNEEIFVRLTQRKSCRDVVDRLLENGELVCQGQSVLRATVEYRLATKAGAESEARLADIPSVEAALEAAISTRVAFDNGRFVSGTALHYGVKVNPICVTRPTDTEPRTLPRNKFDRLAHFVRYTLPGV